MTEKTKEFIEKAKKVHGDKFDYSLVDYKKAILKVKILCKQGHVFEQSPNSHLQGRECVKCAAQNASRRQILGTEKFITKANEVHNNKYDYSLVDYTKNSSEVKIICPIHGEFLQKPVKHLIGRGCSKCAKSGIKLTGSEFILRAKKIHSHKYDYTLVDYKSMQDKVIIKCPTHGNFEQTPASHLRGGCRKCGVPGAYSLEDFLEMSKKIHGNKYDYSLVKYETAKTKVIIKCPTHGEFSQLPTHHTRGIGCPICGGSKQLTTLDFIERSKKMHGDKYSYEKTNYINMNTDVIITCSIHGEFIQLPSSHILGTNCPICSRGFEKKHKLSLIQNLYYTDLLTMDPFEIYTIIGQGKLPVDFRALIDTDSESEERMATLRELKERFSKDSEDEEMPTTETIDSPLDAEEMGDGEPVDEVDDELIGGVKAERELPVVSAIKGLHVLDNKLYAAMDEEAFNSLVQYKIRGLWNAVLNNEKTVAELQSENGGEYFTLIKNTFLDEYKEVSAYIPAEGYSFPFEPNLMQKLTVVRLLKNKSYGNWSGTGAGKTLSFIIASRALDARLTLIVALNSTIKQTCEVIKQVYPDSVTHVDYEEGQVFDRSRHNYLVLNYEKFQQEYSESIFQSLTNNNQVDFIVIDEVHNAKQRTEEEESLRREVLNRLIGRIRADNPEAHSLVMSATPVVNNLYEAKSLLMLLTGLEYADLDVRRNLSNALKIFQQLTLNGLRYTPKYSIDISELTGVNTPELNIDGQHMLDQILDIPNQNHIAIEKLLLKDKLEAIKPFLRKGTIIYSYFTTDFIDKIESFVQEQGFTTGTYTGDESTYNRELNLNRFIGKDIQGNKVPPTIDILIGSRPIGTGVDGLQARCDRMIALTLPWTDSEYTQLKGRIYRQKSAFGHVDIIIPQVRIKFEGSNFWSWDVQRLNLIKFKRTLADAAVDGVFPSKKIPTAGTMFKKAQESLQKWKDRINEGNIIEIKRNLLNIDLYPELADRAWIDKKRAQLGDFSALNNRWSVSRSDTTHERLVKDPTEWQYYHKLYSESRKTWAEIPFVEIAKKIKGRPDWIVGDFGCGENLLAKEITNKVHAFDHVAVDDNVIACDITRVPIEGGVLDVAVFSLSLMGTNYIEYFKEAYRTLRPYGNIFVCEPAVKWEGREEKLRAEIESAGFRCLGAVKNTDKFIYIDGIKY